MLKPCSEIIGLACFKSLSMSFHLHSSLRPQTQGGTPCLLQTTKPKPHTSILGYNHWPHKLQHHIHETRESITIWWMQFPGTSWLERSYFVLTRSIHCWILWKCFFVSLLALLQLWHWSVLFGQQLRGWREILGNVKIVAHFLEYDAPLLVGCLALQC